MTVTLYGQEFDMDINTPDSTTNYYQKLANCKNLEDFKNRILTEINHLGFSDFSLIKLENPHNINSPLITLSKEFIRRYYEEEYHKADVIIPYVKCNTRPILLSVLYKNFTLSPIETDISVRLRKIQAIQKYYGYHDFFHIPLGSTQDNGHIMFSLTSKNENRFNFQQKIHTHICSIQQLAETAEYLCMIRFPDHLGIKPQKNQIKVNKRPLQILSTIANSDMPFDEVASSLNISLSTLNSHLKSVKLAFGVRQTHAAIKQAITHGLISFDQN